MQWYTCCTSFTRTETEKEEHGTRHRWKIDEVGQLSCWETHLLHKGGGFLLSELLCQHHFEFIWLKNSVAKRLVCTEFPSNSISGLFWVYTHTKFWIACWHYVTMTEGWVVTGSLSGNQEDRLKNNHANTEGLSKVMWLILLHAFCFLG